MRQTDPRARKNESENPVQARTFPLLLIATLFTVLPHAVADSTLDPNQPLSANKSNEINHEVDFSVVVTPPYHCKVMKVWIPIPQSDESQQIGKSRFSTFPMKVDPKINVEPAMGNKFAYFEFHNPQGAQMIRHRFTARLWELNWNVDATTVQPVKTWPDSFKPYLKPQSVQEKEKFQQLLSSIVPQPKNPATDTYRVMDWIQNNLKYDHVKASLRASANHALRERCGHCSDYHGLCETMGRSLGYPTRLTYGLALYPKNSPSHCRVESFFPGHGWVSFDLSETQKLIARVQKDEDLDEKSKARLIELARERHRRGFRENSWVRMTTGTNYQLVPKAVAPVAVVRTAYVEADGEVLPDPDPANVQARRFAWMTLHKYKADRAFLKASDYRSLTPRQP